MYLIALISTILAGVLMVLLHKFMIPAFFGNNISLDGKWVMVTGAGRGIGREVCVLLCEVSASLILIDINPDTLERTRQIIEEKISERKSSSRSTQKVLTYTCDVSDFSKIEEVKSSLVDKSVHVDILINNAAIVGEGKELVKSSLEGIHKVFKVNTLGPLCVIKAFLPNMIHRDSGRIINVASAAGRSYACRLSAYCASKAGLIQAHHSLRLELRRKGSNVGTSIVMPWHVSDTPMFHGVRHWWPIRVIFPPLKAKVVAKTIVQLARQDPGRHDVITVPWLLDWFILILHILPISLKDFATELAGGRHGMDTWTAEKKSNT
ncbi:hypothetical protein AAMO2058_000582200 [Amorphochlora amoebiformis]